MDSKTQEKVGKLLSLCRQGVGGEKANAEAMLIKILKQYGMTIADLEQKTEEKVRVTVKYNHPYEKTLFSQVVAQVMEEEDWTIKRYNRTRTIFVDVSPAQKAEIAVRYELYLKAFKDEIPTFMKAFIIKNKIWSSKDTSDDRELTAEDLRAIEMSSGMKRVDVFKQIK